MNFISGDEVTTKERSSLTMQIDSDKYLYMCADTEIALEQSGDEASGKTYITLKSGEIYNDLDSKLSNDAEYQVRTSNATIGVRGTQFHVKYDGETTLIYCTEGTVSVKAEENEIELNAEEAAKVSNGTAEKTELIEVVSQLDDGKFDNYGNYIPGKRYVNVPDFDYKSLELHWDGDVQTDYSEKRDEATNLILEKHYAGTYKDGEYTIDETYEHGIISSSVRTKNGEKFITADYIFYSLYMGDVEYGTLPIVGHVTMYDADGNEILFADVTDCYMNGNIKTAVIRSTLDSDHYRSDNGELYVPETVEFADRESEPLMNIDFDLTHLDMCWDGDVFDSITQYTTIDSEIVSYEYFGKNNGTPYVIREYLFNDKIGYITRCDENYVPYAKVAFERNDDGTIIYCSFFSYYEKYAVFLCSCKVTEYYPNGMPKSGILSPAGGGETIEFAETYKAY